MALRPGLLRVFASKWTCEAALGTSSVSVIADALKKAGFAGLEASLSDLGPTPAHRAEAAGALRERGLGLGLGLYSGWTDYEQYSGVEPPATHLRRLEGELRAAEDLQPCFLNLHSGDDWWDDAQDREYFAGAAGLLECTPCRASHETHRGRPLGHPARARRLLEAFPDLFLTLDVSHWFLVCERYFPLDPLVASRVRHVHARAGSTQRPQLRTVDSVDVEDEDEETRRALRACEAAWAQAFEAAPPGLTFTPEYGPPPYQPHTDKPAADLWAVTLGAADRLRNTFDPF